MRSWLTYLLFYFILGTAFAQNPEPADSIAEEVESETMAIDTLNDVMMFRMPMNYEYIPAEETPELVADRLACIQQTIRLPYNSNIHGFINYFTIRNREYTRLMLRRKDLYFPLFEKYLAKYNLPQELKYLSIIESGLNPRAVSRASAAGLWQFMSFTGKYFDLQNDWYFDERMDPEKSTEAACRYLSQLYNMFHDWDLALAAYNSGPGTVRRALHRADGKRSFWEIYKFLPRETRSYVPQFVAIIYAMNYAEEHNMIETALELPIPHDTLMIKKYLHIETFAKLTGSCLEEMLQLNPSIRHNAIPETGRSYTVRLPIAAKIELEKDRFRILDSASRVGRKEFELLAKNKVGGTAGRELMVYRVKNGDVLGSIAMHHSVRVDDLRKWNSIRGNMIRTGQRLNIYVSGSKKSIQGLRQPTTEAIANSAEVIVLPGTSKTYVVQPGDTLWDISRKFQGVTVEKIKAVNKLKSNKLEVGMKLIIG